MEKTLYFGDNLHVLREHIKSESVNLIYLDPPFNSNVNYNVFFQTPAGRKSQAQAEAFEDTWSWGEDAQISYEDVMKSGGLAASILRSFKSFLGENDLMAYLAMMAVRLVELRRVLKESGSIYLHCDPTASHYLKILMDSVFDGYFVSEIVWQRTNARSTVGRWPRLHDTLLHFSKSRSPFYKPMLAPGGLKNIPHTLITWADGQKYQTYELTAPGTSNGRSGMPWRGYDPSKFGRHWANSSEKMEAWDTQGLIHWPRNGGFPRRRDERPFQPQLRMVTVGDVWTDIDRLNQTAKERLGYPTQKPLTLLGRIIEASSEKGDTVLDPFCGCGTALHAAEALERDWIGIDITHVAIQIIMDRLRRYFPSMRPIVRGRPEDIDGAHELAARDKYQFQWWAASLVKAQPRGGYRKGADRGIDGEIYFKLGVKDDGRAIVSVKGGTNLNPAMVRDLVGTRNSEGADMALLITLHQPSQEMVTAAAKDGSIGEGESRVPRTQILTIEQLLLGIPFRTPTAVLYDSVTSASQARRRAGGRKLKLPTLEDLRRSPQMPLPIPGGKAKFRHELEYANQDTEILQVAEEVIPFEAKDNSSANPKRRSKRKS